MYFGEAFPLGDLAEGGIGFPQDGIPELVTGVVCLVGGIEHSSPLSSLFNAHEIMSGKSSCEYGIRMAWGSKYPIDPARPAFLSQLPPFLSGV